MSTVIDQATGYEYHDVDFGLEDVPDLEARLARLLAAGKRVVKVRYIGKPAWVLLGHKEVWDAFLDTGHYPCSAAHLRHSEPTMGRNLLCLDGEEHRIKRALVAPAFQPAKIREYTESLLRPLANRLIDDFRGRNELDLVAQYTRRLPLQVITRLLDIPAEDEPQLIEWIDGLFLYP
ncbi:MAG TPA: hypothetical protein VK025_06615 [Steroidobacter sp.]|nr:hypothetical protein [Steroidobacter sp.]